MSGKNQGKVREILRWISGNPAVQKGLQFSSKYLHSVSVQQVGLTLLSDHVIFEMCLTKSFILQPTYAKRLILLLYGRMNLP